MAKQKQGTRGEAQYLINLALESERPGFKQALPFSSLPLSRQVGPSFQASFFPSIKWKQQHLPDRDVVRIQRNICNVLNYIKYKLSISNVLNTHAVHTSSQQGENDYCSPPTEQSWRELYLSDGPSTV